MSKRSSWPTSYELDVLHPATANWLQAHDYSFTHEYRLPNRKVVDFHATKSDGQRYVVECKLSWSQAQSSVRQVVGYRQQFNSDCRAALAVPSMTVPDHVQCLLEKYDIDYFPIEISPMTNLSVSIPSDWIIPMLRRRSAHKARSQQDYIRRLIEADLGISHEDVE